MIDLEALWSVEFVTNIGTSGAGVIVLETERAFGGDSNYYYIGNFKVVHDTIQAEITATYYHGEPFSIIGPRNQFTVKLSGKYAEDTFDLDGYIDNNPQAKVRVRLTKRAQLP